MIRELLAEAGQGGQMGGPGARGHGLGRVATGETYLGAARAERFTNSDALTGLA